MTMLQPSAFLERLLRYLIPYFLGVSSDIAEARAEALETLASYGARTRAELLAAVQIIIFGLSALEALGEAKGTEMSPSMRLRFRGCANNLNRSGHKTELLLAKRLACDPPAPTAGEPLDDLAETQAEATLQQTQAQVETAHAHARAHARIVAPRPVARPPAQPPAAAQKPLTQSEAELNKQLWGSAMIQTLQDMGMPVQPIPPAASPHSASTAASTPPR